jgi:putative nucleotidyltransferase with HDIG domain
LTRTPWAYRAGQAYAALTARVTDADRAEAINILSPSLQSLFLRMRVRDQRHALQVLHRLHEAGTDPILAQAALLHDVGKVEAYLGVPGRTLLVLAEALGAVGAVARLPVLGPRLGRYLLHPEIGARMLADAGADRRLIEIVREHQAKHPRMSETMTLQAADGRE